MKRSRFQRGSLRKVKRSTGQVWVFRFVRTRPEDGKRVEGKVEVGPVRLLPSEGAAWKEVERLHLHEQINQLTVTTRMTFGDLARFYADHELENSSSELASTTKATYRLVLKRHILPRWKSANANNMKPLEIEQWLQSLELENPTKDKLRRVMSLVFKYAAKHEQILAGTRNPLELVRQPSTSNYQPIIITPSQGFAILMVMPQPEQTLTLLVAATGLRISEALGLQWQDMDWEHQQIHVRRRWVANSVGEPKTQASKAPVPMAPVLARFMKEWRKQTAYSAPTDWVFASKKLKGLKPRVSNMLAWCYLRPAAIAAGVKIAEGQRFGFHNLRHSLATFLVTKAKADPKTVQALLRHANVRTTLQLYTQSVSDDRLAAQTQMLEAIFQQQPGTVH